MVSDRDRHEVYVALEHGLGEGPTETLMQLLPPVGWADVARASDLEALGVGLRGEMAELRAELRGEMAELRAELRGEMAELRAELRGEMGSLRGEMGSLRGEMGSLRGGIKSELASLRNQLFVANVATTCAVAGLVLAAAKLT
jgi:hypothetical protein